MTVILNSNIQRSNIQRANVQRGKALNTPAFKRQGYGGNYGTNGWGVGSAVLFTAGGTVAGLLHGRFFNRQGGKLTELAEDATLESVKAALNVNQGKNILSSAKRRTAKEALSILEEAAEASGKKANKLVDQAKKCLTEGTKPYGKAALIGAIIGFCVFGFHKIIKHDDFE